MCIYIYIYLHRDSCDTLCAPRTQAAPFRFWRTCGARAVGSPDVPRG